MTMHKAFTSSSQSVGIIAKQDEEKIVRCISNLFKATALYFDNPLSQSKAELIADEILGKYEYRSLKLEDILAICIRIKESDTFKLTVAKIMSEVRKYSKDREKLAIERSLQKSDSQKSSINTGLEARLNKHFRSLPNASKIATKRSKINKNFR